MLCAFFVGLVMVCVGVGFFIAGNAIAGGVTTVVGGLTAFLTKMFVNTHKDALNKFMTISNKLHETRNILVSLASKLARNSSCVL